MQLVSCVYDVTNRSLDNLSRIRDWPDKGINIVIILLFFCSSIVSFFLVRLLSRDVPSIGSLSMLSHRKVTYVGACDRRLDILYVIPMQTVIKFSGRALIYATRKAGIFVLSLKDSQSATKRVN